MYYNNKNIGIEICIVDNSMHPWYNHYMWVIPKSRSYGFITPIVATYIIRKIKSLDDNTPWYHADRLIWNMINNL
jgi:hypothetical protein